MLLIKATTVEKVADVKEIFFGRNEEALLVCNIIFIVMQWYYESLITPLIAKEAKQSYLDDDK